MSKSNTTENDFIKFVFHGTAMPAYGSNLQVNLHTADPGESGVATTNAPTYTGYAAVAVARDATGWVNCDPDGTPNASGNSMKNDDEITFPECTGVSDDEVMTHGSISVVATGQILYKGALTASIRVTNLITPRFPAGTAIFSED
jgi:hypothetical protein